jgi:MOSC domain-containing protein YiiM
MEDKKKAAHVFQINLSEGGVPKLAVHQAEVTFEGVIGDKNRHPHVHGGPERALCLYSVEKILQLQQEGHTVFPGAMGENLTLAGLDWTELSPGDKLRIGETIIIEFTRYTTPCSALQPFFIDGKFIRVSQDKNPGWARLYARVLEPGVVRVGDIVRLEKVKEIS